MVDTLRVPSEANTFSPKVSSSFCQKAQKYWKGHSLQNGTRFCKNFQKMPILMTFSSVLAQNYQILKMFSLDLKLSNLAK